MPVGWAGTLGVLLVAALTAAPSAAGKPASVTPQGLTSVWQVPNAGLVKAGELRSSGTVQLGAFHLPRDAREGHGEWYVIRLVGRLALSRSPGECALSASTNGRTSAQFIIKTHRNAASLSETGWIQGSRLIRTRSRFVHLDYRNYVQISGVRPGLNPLTVSLRNLQRSSCIRDIVLSPGTGIYVTTANPEELSLHVPRTLNATKGVPVTIQYTLVRRGGWPDRGATVVLNPPDGMRVEGPRTAHFSHVGHVQDGVFHVVPQVNGPEFVQLSVPARYNEPQATVALSVGAGEASWVRRKGIPVLLSAALLVGAATLTRAARRDRRRDRTRDHSSGSS